jgi:hypothetical protein
MSSFLTIKPVSMFTNESIKDQPIRLTVGQLEEANHVINAFFEGRNPSSIREELRQWYEAVIASNHPGNESGEERVGLFFLYNQLELLIEAAFVLDKNQEHKG